MMPPGSPLREAAGRGLSIQQWITRWITRCILTTRHRVIGVQYLFLALIAVSVGTLLSLVMRIHLVWPAVRIPFWGSMKPEDYMAVMTLHGTLMIFFVLTTAPQSGFANLVLPEQIGAQRMALPWLNAAAFWGTALALVVLLGAVFVPGGGPISGWTAYPPLSAIAAAGPGQATGMDFWLASLAIFSIASCMGAVSLLATIMVERCPGMTLFRMPLTVWSWMVTAILILLAFSALFAALVLLFCDRHFGTSFFIPSGDLVSGTIFHRGNGSPLLWLHLFWFFGHPEVYIAILPGMGLVSSLLANFSRRPVVGYRVLVGNTVLIGLLGFAVWGHHMFVSGMNPYAGTAFALTTMAIAVPSTAEVLSWLASIWGGGLRLNTPMLFALGFVSLFIAGGLTGPLLAQPALDSYLHNTYFVVGHFHLIMGMAGAFSIFAGVYYWFPLMSGRRMHEGLGKWHFWLSLAGAYATFLPMHLVGLAGQPRHYPQIAESTPLLATLLPVQREISLAAFALASAQLLFLANIAWSAFRGSPAPHNPWQATTLEWIGDRHAAIAVTRGPYQYGIHGGKADFQMQWEPDTKEE
jgi:cytochrome c oxidase subunit I